MAVDRTPGIESTLITHTFCVLPGGIQNAVAVFEKLANQARLAVQEEGNNVGFRIPEIVALVVLAA